MSSHVKQHNPHNELGLIYTTLCTNRYIIIYTDRMKTVQRSPILSLCQYMGLSLWFFRKHCLKEVTIFHRFLWMTKYSVSLWHNTFTFGGQNRWALTLYKKLERDYESMLYKNIVYIVCWEFYRRISAIYEYLSQIIIVLYPYIFGNCNMKWKIASMKSSFELCRYDLR